MGILDKLMGRSGDEDYVNIDLGQFEEVSAGSSSEILVRMAELNDLDVLPDIKAQIERGNVVLVDISPLRREKGLLDEAIGELKDVVEDLRGDIAGLGDNLVIVVPRRMRIDRENVLGGED
ncbi:cell division protein SepF [Methanotrichaceae archaeon M04Ac]|uniref:Cell division protein SepF n=1 Tax=Candidatus Methanocrinis alkalitolerans TaxID=3033395 RepID=A0ABT5XFV8_9EURY|nr:cell division protein SepF [Candidatus Methanocrinis alkalitolerans]MCR3883173.1 cell division protein SepF [Methanothrix sp.]MDF0593610.1 cell division protein SepF [Candidatus Methanocrinis alkalitolerans]